MKWIQHCALPGLDDEQLRDYLAASHQLVAVGLSRKMRRELGLDTHADR
jgi:predicted DNA-binding protein (MmcQ/YjbR family)